MFFGGRKKSETGAAKPSALDELLITEQEIAAQMSAAGKEAAALTAAARDDAGSIELSAAAALSTELTALDARDAAVRAESARELEEESVRLVGRYRSLGDEEIGRLAAFVVTEITGIPPARAP